MSKIPFFDLSDLTLLEPLDNSRSREVDEKPRKKTLPIVDRMRANIDKLFVQYVGPIGTELAEEHYEDWLRQGNVGPLGLKKYIAMLSRDVPHARKQAEFVVKAVAFLRP